MPYLNQKPCGYFVIHRREGSEDMFDDVKVGPMDRDAALALAKERKGRVVEGMVVPNYSETVADFEEPEPETEPEPEPEPEPKYHKRGSQWATMVDPEGSYPGVLVTSRPISPAPGTTPGSGYWITVSVGPRRVRWVADCHPLGDPREPTKRTGFEACETGTSTCWGVRRFLTEDQ